MTLYTDSRIAMQAAAYTPAVIAAPTGSPSVAEILFRPWRRIRILRELQGLDERMLRDIGVSRSELDRVAADAAGGEEWVLVSLAKYLGRKLAMWSSRRDAYRRLMALDDRMLADIGISRSEIPAVIRAMGAETTATSSGFEAEVVLPLKQWNLWRDAHKQLSQLDNRMLSDIGLVRGDIDWVADELAQRALRKPANANSKTPHTAA